MHLLQCNLTKTFSLSRDQNLKIFFTSKVQLRVQSFQRGFAWDVHSCLCQCMIDLCIHPWRQQCPRASILHRDSRIHAKMQLLCMNHHQWVWKCCSSRSPQSLPCCSGNVCIEACARHDHPFGRQLHQWHAISWNHWWRRQQRNHQVQREWHLRKKREIKRNKIR